MSTSLKIYSKNILKIHVYNTNKYLASYLTYMDEQYVVMSGIKINKFNKYYTINKYNNFSNTIEVKDN